jgi:hypothetical protein
MCGMRRDNPACQVGPFRRRLAGGSLPRQRGELQVVANNDQSLDFMRLRIGSGRVEGEFFAATLQALAHADSFCLDVAAHRFLSCDRVRKRTWGK